MGAQQAELTVQLEAPKRDGRGKRLFSSLFRRLPAVVDQVYPVQRAWQASAETSSDRPLRCAILLIVLYGFVWYCHVPMCCIASVLYYAPRHRPAPKTPDNVTTESITSEREITWRCRASKQQATSSLLSRWAGRFNPEKGWKGDKCLAQSVRFAAKHHAKSPLN